MSESDTVDLQVRSSDYIKVNFYLKNFTSQMVSVNEKRRENVFGKTHFGSNPHFSAFHSGLLAAYHRRTYDIGGSVTSVFAL